MHIYWILPGICIFIESYLEYWWNTSQPCQILPPNYKLSNNRPVCRNISRFNLLNSSGGKRQIVRDTTTTPLPQVQWRNKGGEGRADIRPPQPLSWLQHENDCGPSLIKFCKLRKKFQNLSSSIISVRISNYFLAHRTIMTFEDYKRNTWISPLLANGDRVK